MAGIEAHADAARAIQLADDGRQMLEAVTQRASLPRGVLEQRHRLTPRPRPERRADSVCNQRESLGLRALGARAGVDDDAEEPERVRAVQLVDEGGNRLRAEAWDPGRQIDQVACV